LPKAFSLPQIKAGRAQAEEAQRPGNKKQLLFQVGAKAPSSATPLSQLETAIVIFYSSITKSPISVGLVFYEQALLQLVLLHLFQQGVKVEVGF
jgi:hypothetical protein